MAHNNGNGKRWGQIKEIHVNDAPGKRGSSSEWDGLYEELVVRLKRTGNEFALEIPFAKVDDARFAQMALRKRFTKLYGKDSVSLWRRTKLDGSAVLYVQRGNAWKGRTVTD